jgi:hypothetical protein
VCAATDERIAKYLAERSRVNPAAIRRRSVFLGASVLDDFYLSPFPVRVESEDANFRVAFDESDPRGFSARSGAQVDVRASDHELFRSRSGLCLIR